MTLKKQANIPPEGDLNKFKFFGLKKKKKEIIISIVCALGVLFILYVTFLSAPANFPTGKFVTIPDGMNVSAAGDYLQGHSIIRYPFLFKLFVMVFNRKGVIAGDYLFKSPLGVLSVARRMAIGQFDVEEIRVVIQEGMSNYQIAALLKKKLPLFDDKHFLQIVDDKEGMLFPDTYFIKLSAKEGMVAEMLVNNFNVKIKPLVSDINKSGHTLNEILTMASIIEEEANTAVSRRMVSGVLWNRIAKGMRLQVDPVFAYLMDKYDIHVAVGENLLHYDSPYNTYLYKGLPPGPITNPSLDAIDAALHPTASSYLYYLSDKSGNMHYAKTFIGHKANKASYMGI